jgi:hypothetical protein
MTSAQSPAAFSNGLVKPKDVYSDSVSILTQLGRLG